MDSIAPPKVPDLMPARVPALSSEPGPAAQAADRRIAEQQRVMRAEALPDDATTHLDADAKRFVHTLTDASTMEILRRYPSEAQLAYSRGVVAYFRALAGG